MTIALSHFEIKARDVAGLEDFYTRILGFVVTDRSPANAHAMVFLSLNPGEHHQIVLIEAGGGEFSAIRALRIRTYDRKRLFFGVKMGKRGEMGGAQ